MKILTVLGARPQFIKAGPVSKEIRKRQERGENVQEIIVHTGQHYDKNMSDVFFEELYLPKPDYYLGIGGKSQGRMTGEMIAKLEEVMIKEKPDVVLIYGDTNSTLAGAIAASKLRIPIAHVEAGLRSFNIKMSEEINRILTDRISKWLFCPTSTAVKNLRNEGFPYRLSDGEYQIVRKVGDVMYDAVLYYKRKAKKPRISGISHNFILATIHREENTDEERNLKNILEALEEIGRDVQVILPLHPRTKRKVHEYGIRIKNVNIVDPVSYLEMMWLLDNCRMVITDSGGLQKEAYFFRKPCITLREETEWIELVENRFNVLTGSNKEKILESYETFNFNSKWTIDLYGNGKASEQILELLLVSIGR